MEITDINPRPPISISTRMTNCPKKEYVDQTSTTDNPVTQTAEVDVKRDVTRPIDPGVLVDIGSIKATVPSIIIRKNAIAIF